MAPVWVRNQAGQPVLGRLKAAELLRGQQEKEDSIISLFAVIDSQVRLPSCA